MRKLPSLAIYALMAPAITLGVGTAFANDPPAGASPSATEQRSTQDYRSPQDQRSTQDERQMPGQAQKDQGISTADRAKEQHTAADRAQQHVKAHGTYLSSAPADSFRSDDLIGANLKSSSDNETIGEISDLVIDKDGQIVAVIVEAGGFLGLGTKDVAVSWDSIERQLNDDGDDYNLSVNTTKDALRNAPEYKSEASKY